VQIRSSVFIILTASMGCTLAAAAPVTAPATTVTDPATKAKVTAQYLNLPLSFEVNEGQFDPRVKALARGSGYGLFLTSSESVLVLNPGHKDGSMVRVRNIGANPEPKVSGLNQQESHSNYYVGNDPSKWRTHVANFGQVKYSSIYPGVDLVYYGNQRQLEYDYVVAPGADPNSIRLEVDGARKLRVDRQGDLVLELRHGAIRHHKPVIYQDINGSRREIAGNFILHGNRVAFQVGDYDHSKELVIDPSLAFLTYLGGSSVDEGKAIAITSTVGVTLVAGVTTSTNFPLATPLYNTFVGTADGFVSALDPQGATLLDSTYVGGTAGATLVTGIAVDSALLPSMLYVAGTTTSQSLPMVNPTQGTYGGGASDAWVARINLQITLISLNPLKFTLATSIAYATYLGGSGAESLTGLAMDQVTKDVFVTGFTTSSNFPLTAGVLQTHFGGVLSGFVTRYAAATGVPVFSTYIGGSGLLEPAAIAIYTNLSAGNAVTEYIVGQAIVSSTGKEAFLTALNGSGTSSPFTKIIGSSSTVSGATAVTTDSAGGIYMTGETNYASLPVVSPVQATFGGGGNDAFIAAYSPTGTPTFVSYFGGAGYDWPYAIGVFLTNNADLTTSINLFIAGYTTGGLTMLNPVQGTYGGGSTDGFVTMFSTSHNSPFALGYSTYLGGNGIDIIYALGVGTSGNVRVTGLTNSTNLQVNTGVLQSTLAGSYDAFVGEIQTTP